MVLYKYGSVGSAIKILDAVALKVTPPNELNDPFELTPKSVKALSRHYLHQKALFQPEHFRGAYDDFVANEHSTIDFPTFINMILEMPDEPYRRLCKMYKESLTDLDLNAIKFASDHLVVLCLTTKNDSIPMWSHYSNNHKGVVIGFDTADSCFQAGTGLMKVKYRTGRFQVDPRSTATWDAAVKKTTQVIMTKSKDWEYENEYRICYKKKDVIATQDEKGNPLYLIRVWSSTIRSVIFGCWTSPSDKAEVQSFLGMKRFSHVQILKAERHPGDFKLQILPA